MKLVELAELNGKKVDLHLTSLCPKQKLRTPDPMYCREHCVRKPSFEDLSACNLVI